MSQDEAEDAALLSCLQACHDLYSRQQQFAHSTRKGFMNVAKARQSMGRSSVSVLDCREELVAQFRIAPCSSGGEDDPGAATWRRFDYASERSVRAVPTQVRRRGATASDGAPSADATLEEVADGPPAHQKDPILLFGGLVPPPLRKAKQDFSAALEQAILAANAVREILAAERAIAASESGAAASSER